MNFAGMEKRSFGLRVKFAIIVIGVGLIGLAALIHVSDYLTAKDFEGHIKERAFLVTEDILFHLHRGMVSGNHYGILNSLDSHLAAIKVVELRLFNANGQEIPANDQGSREARVEEVLKSGRWIDFYREDKEQKVKTFIIPIVNRAECQSCHGKSERPMAALLVSLSLRGMKESLAEERREHSIPIVLVVIATSIAITIAVSRLFLKPLGLIQRGTEAMERGDLRHQIPITAEDEIGALARKFNRMAETLQRSFGELKDKNMQLAEQFHLVSRSQKEWQETFESITDPISLIKDDCTIIKANRAFRETFREYLPQDETVHKKCHELFETCWLANCPLKINPGDKTPTKNEIHIAPTGKIFDVSMFPYYSHEEDFTGSVFIAKDITEMKKNEMRMIMNERLSALGQVASSIAHEINTPLATIAACAEGLLRRMKKGKWDSAFFEKYLEIIEEEIHRCTKLTKSILSTVKNIPEEKKDMDIHAVLDKTLEMFGFLGRLKKVQVVRKYDGIPVFRGSESQLKQVFLSIIGNGLDAMNDEGTLTLDSGTEGDTIFVRINDTGPGIPSDLFDKIFEPFFTTRSEKGGTGLGLSTANKIIKESNGRIEVTSEKGQGASFKIILPM